MNKQHTKAPSRATWAVMAVFFLPLLFAGLLYLTRNHWELPTKQHGELIIPPLTVSTLALNRENGEPWQFSQEPSLWRLLLVRPDCLDDLCSLQLQKINSIHEATGKDFKRVGLVLIMPGLAVDKNLIENFNYLHRLILLQDHLLNPGIYIMDPNGYIILYYPLEAPAKHMLEDLRHLLRASQIG
ncbi:MAG TPA: hypothetical protein VI522_03840 [Gammaproteobacteria bacterium]|nr:hypothetical protein [Gammaproteobacteria bacterium]